MSNLADRMKFKAINKKTKEVYKVDNADITSDKIVLVPLERKDSGMLTDKKKYDIIQSTGVRDRNNNLIFEGDILRIEDIMSPEKVRFEEVAWNTFLGGFFPLYEEFMLNSTSEVVANIYADEEEIHSQQEMVEEIYNSL